MDEGKVMKGCIRRIITYFCFFCLFCMCEMHVKASGKEEYVFFSSEQEAQEIAEAFGGELTGYSHGIATISIVEISMFCGDKAEENLVKEYNGVKIYPDTVFTLDNEEGTFDRQDYLTDLGVREAWSISRGQGIKVAVIDSGVDDSHEDLAHAVIYTGSVIPQECYGDFLDESYKGNFDNLGHGTHVAGIIAASDNGKGTVGIAPDCSIISIKALEKKNGKGYGKTSWIARAIIEAIEREADVINLSVGGIMVGDSVLHEAIQRARDADIPVICAAGNNSSQNMFYPAAYPETIAVSSARKDKDGYIFDDSYSNFGNWIDFCAPGTDIYSTYPGGYASMTGTSMACPIVTGAVTLVLSKKPDLTINQLMTILSKTAKDIGDDGKDNLYGYGMVDVYALMNEFVDEPAPTVPVPNISDGHYLMEGTEIQLTVTPSDAVIYYTMDGTDPTLDSTIYSSGIPMKDATQETVTIKAFAVNKRGAFSETGIFQYHILPKQKELVHMEGEIKDDILPLYYATKDIESEKMCRKYSLLVPMGKRVTLSLFDSAPELGWRAYENKGGHPVLIGDYEKNEQELVWKNTRDSTEEILLCVIWNSDLMREVDIPFSFRWTMEDFEIEKEDIDNANGEDIDEENAKTEMEDQTVESFISEVASMPEPTYESTESIYESVSEPISTLESSVVLETDDEKDMQSEEQGKLPLENTEVISEQKQTEIQKLEPEIYLEPSSVDFIEDVSESQKNHRSILKFTGLIFFVSGIIYVIFLFYRKNKILKGENNEESSKSN